MKAAGSRKVLGEVRSCTRHLLQTRFSAGCHRLDWSLKEQTGPAHLCLVNRLLLEPGRGQLFSLKSQKGTGNCGRGRREPGPSVG